MLDIDRQKRLVNDRFPREFTVVPTVTQMTSSGLNDSEASKLETAFWIPEVISGVVAVLFHASTDPFGGFVPLASNSTASVLVPYPLSQDRYLALREMVSVPPTSIPMRRLGIVNSDDPACAWYQLVPVALQNVIAVVACLLLVILHE